MIHFDRTSHGGPGPLPATDRGHANAPRVWEAEYTVVSGERRPRGSAVPQSEPVTPLHEAIPYTESVSARRALTAFLTHDRADVRGREVDVFA